MKQFLRSFLTLLMLVVWASGFAASGDIFTLVTAESELKAGDVIIIVNQTAKKALSTEQRDYNRGACAITISGKDVTRADNAQEITLEGASGSWYFNVGNGYLYAASSKKNYLLTQTEKDDNSKAQITFSSSSATIKFLGKNTRNLLKYNSSNTLFSCYASGQSAVAIYKKKSTKTATTLTFPKPTINIEEGNETTFAGQPATLKTTGETVLNKTITYTTNNDAMFEAYEANVGPKALKASAYGTAIVTAKFNGDDTYEASTATYTVNYTEKEKPATTLDFGFATKTVNIDETFTAAATLKSGETAITGAVTYSSSNTKVAYVEEATGEVKALAAGKAKITATFASTSEYKGSTASYELTVVDPNLIILDESTDKGTISTDQGQNDAIEKGNIVLKGYNIALNAKNTSYYKIYSKGYFTISAKEGIITKIAINCTGSDTNDYGPGHLSSDTEGYSYAGKVGTWEGNATSVKITNTDTKQVRIKSIEITVKNKVITLDENLNNTFSEEKGVTVKTVRTLVANKWNTFCVPFETEIAGTALEGATIKVIGTIEGNVINLVDATKIEAGVPYLVRPTTGDIVNPTFKNVTISVTTPKEAGNDEYKFVGTYSPKTINKGEFGKIWGVTAEGKLAKINEGTTMKGLRAYFVFPTNTAAAKLNFDGETTGINNIETNAAVNGKVYNLNGQYVGNSLNGLKKGIYVVNGKKVIK